jgi:hypothetical protein
MNLMHAKVRIGEPTRFDVSSNRWGCTECESRFLKIEHPFLDEGCKCPDCGKGLIEERYHLVDLASWDLAGQCSCEWHAFSIVPKLKAMTRERRLMNPPRCAHIEYARNFCIDFLLKLNQLEENGGKAPDEI